MGNYNIPAIFCSCIQTAVKDKDYILTVMPCPLVDQGPVVWRNLLTSVPEKSAASIFKVEEWI
jgi:hypothetical protein